MAKYLISIFILQIIVDPAYSQRDNAGLFLHHVIADSLPGTQEWGTGAFTLADYDSDGDLDVTISPRADSGRIYWYEHTTTRWIIHLIGIGDGSDQLGGAALDVDRDGKMDLVLGRIWFRNPGMLKSNPDNKWERIVYNEGLPFENHDIAVSDMNQDGIIDIICYSQNYQSGVLAWYDAKDPRRWIKHEISSGVNKHVSAIPGSNGIHGGFAPRGVGDIDGDQFPDVVTPAGWFRNPGKDEMNPWELHKWSFAVGIFPNPYGLSWRSWVVDLDKDGDSDIVYTDCDVRYSNGHWIENKGNLSFENHNLPGPGDSTGSFHSLAVADFDSDGDLDIVSGEQEDPSPVLMKPLSLKERGFIWLNNGNKKAPEFQVKVFHANNPGFHEMQTGDIDGDGDIDLVSKIWKKDYDGKYLHIDWWENVLTSKSQSQLKN